MCCELELPCQVINPLGEAWQWLKIKRETDRALVNFRQRVIQRSTAERDHIRAMFQARGLQVLAGHQAWTDEAICDRAECCVFANPEPPDAA